MTTLIPTGLNLSAAGFALAAAFAAPALAQDAAFELPARCVAAAGMDHAAMGHGDMPDAKPGDMASGMMGMDGMDAMASMPAHVQDNMRKMMVTMPAMHDGMMNADADVAFACGMIAHHQGAIDMAEVVLEHGDDDAMKALAQEIIATQVDEITQMTTWLDAQPE
ncbi:protein of unknown function [Loktanella fryxellensis]|uniref:DUF305 domain-containing protein n=1 Tax=Loktanella fryxellensis TaxID=245187 RepID=A0A1H7ZN15_9RHOB|nr:DUF305 domain-containing protein [Loktanella fryxellensis]SEM58938.1 protein of unknown function [Loktanella fryxellensis]